MFNYLHLNQNCFEVLYSLVRKVYNSYDPINFLKKKTKICAKECKIIFFLKTNASSPVIINKWNRCCFQSFTESRLNIYESVALPYPRV